METEDLKTIGAAPIGRRRVLQGVAVGGAIWAAPSVLTLNRASAATGSAQSCGPLNCNSPFPTPACAQNPECECVALNGGGTACYGGAGSCNNPGDGNICNSDADCVSGGYGTTCFQLDPNSCTECGGTTYCDTPCADAEGVRHNAARSSRGPSARGPQPVGK